MRNKGSYILARLAGLVLVLAMSVVYAVQTPYFQTRIARYAISYITEALDGKVYCKELKVMPSGALMMSDILILDRSPYTEDAHGNPTAPVDTVLTARSLTATFTLAGLFRHEGLHMGRVSLQDACFHLVIEPNEYGTNITRIFGLLPHEGKTAQGSIFDLQKFSADSIHFMMTNLVSAPGHVSGKGIDFNDMDLVTDIRGRRLSFADGVFKGSVPSLSLREKSGYIIDRLSADVQVGNGKTTISDIEIDDPWSRVRARSFTMNYESAASFGEFEEKVLMGLDLKRSRLSLRTIMYFSGAFDGSGTVLDIQAGRARGYVNDLAVERLVFTDIDSGISGVFNGRVTGLPDFRNMLVEARLENCRFTFGGLDRLVAGLSQGVSTPLSGIAPAAGFVADISASGPLARLAVKASLTSGIGSLEASGEVRNLSDRLRPLSVSASLTTGRLDLGELTGNKKLGPLSSSSRLRATVYPGNPEVTVDTLRITSFTAMGYTYNSIGASGTLSDGTACITVSSDDPNLLLKASACADLTDKDYGKRYSVTADLSNIDLYAIKADERTVSRVSGSVAVNFSHKGRYIDGTASVTGLTLENAGGRNEIGDIELDAYSFAAEQYIKMKAPFADLVISAGSSPAEFIDDLQQLTLRRELPALYPNPSPQRATSNFHLDISMHDSRNLLSFIAPGVYIADSTSLCLEVLDNGEMLASLNSGSIAFNSNYFRDLDLKIDNLGESLNLSVTGSTMKFGGMRIQSPEVSALAFNDMLEFDFSFDDLGALGGAGRLAMEAEFGRDSTNSLTIDAHPLESFVGSERGPWTFGKSDIAYRRDELRITDFSIGNGTQSISVNGGYSLERDDTLSVYVNNFDLSLLNDILGLGTTVKGKADGTASLHSGPGKNPGMLLDMKLDSLMVGSADAGRIVLSSLYEEGNDDIEIFIRNEMAGNDVLFAKGMFFPAERRLDLDASLDNFPVNIAGQFVPELFSEVSGTLSGDISLRHASGTSSVSSDNLKINSVVLTPRMTGVRYTVDGIMSLGDDGLHFSSLAILDSDNGIGSISGTLGFRNFRNFELDAAIGFENLKFLDIIQSGHGVYGLVRASGDARIKGPVNGLEIDADLRTSGPGNIHIPTFGSATGSTGDLLTFTQKKQEDDYESIIEGLSRSGAGTSDLKLRARLGIQPSVRAYVEMDKSSGNMASFTAQGNLVMNLRPSQDIFDLTGDLTVNEGEYQFSIPGIFSKAFTIQQGSSIRFVGTLPDTQLDINAVYSQKASLDALIPDSSEGLKRTVNCGINISDRLRNPRLSFSIDIPDLNPTVRSQVESALSTDDKVQKQFVALLVLGSFMPDESSGIIDSNDILLSNVTGFMAGQLNSILQKLDIPVDIGIDYHNNSTTGSNIFDVAISTQLFNNRVIVGGSVANRGYANTAGASQGDVIGDLDIQIKLDPEGRYRFNMFSHSADEYSSILDLSQRNGVGISFQKEYYKFSDFLRSIFNPVSDSTSTAKRRQPREMTTIIIGDDGDER